MKRPGLPPRRAWIRRSTKPLLRSSPPSVSPRPRTRTPRKPIPTVNAKRQARRKAEYQAFIHSPEWKAIRAAALKRAGHRCEELIPNPLARREHAPSLMRCTATMRLTVHHRRYTRFGGQELPSDLQVLCKEHHDALHASQPWKRIA